MKPSPALFRIAAIIGALAVVLGAMGAHGHVADVLAKQGSTEHWKTASHYHLAHCAVLLVLGTLSGGSKALRFAWMAIFLGVIIFSGSLYVLAYTGIKWLGAITPIGGLAMIIGWVVTAFAAPRIQACTSGT